MVYVVTDWTGFVKIGVTHQMQRRIPCIQTGNPRKIDVLITFETESLKQDKKLERIFHVEFRKERVVFDDGHETEWFKDSILDFLLKRTTEFIDYIKEKYELKIVRFVSDICYQQIEERRIDAVKDALTNNILYGQTKQDHNRPMFKIGDIVQIKNDVKAHFWHGGFSGSIRMPTKYAKVISVNKDSPTSNFWYELENGYAYSEEMLELYNSIFN